MMLRRMNEKSFWFQELEVQVPLSRFRRCHCCEAMAEVGTAGMAGRLEALSSLISRMRFGDSIAQIVATCADTVGTMAGW